MWQLLTVRKVQEEESEDCDEDGCDEADERLSEAEPEGLVSSLGSTSLSASTIGFRSICKLLTFSTASTPSLTASLTLLVVSITQVTSEKAVLKRPPSRSRFSIFSETNSLIFLLRFFLDLQGSTPSGGSGSFPKRLLALGRISSSLLITAVAAGASGRSIHFCRTGKTPAITIDRSEALD